MKVRDIVKEIAAGPNYQKLVKLIEGCVPSNTAASEEEIREMIRGIEDGIVETLTALQEELTNKIQKFINEVLACYKSKVHPGYNASALEKVPEIKKCFNRYIEEYLPIYWRFLEKARAHRKKPALMPLKKKRSDAIFLTAVSGW